MNTTTTTFAPQIVERQLTTINYYELISHHIISYHISHHISSHYVLSSHNTQMDRIKTSSPTSHHHTSHLKFPSDMYSWFITLHLTSPDFTSTQALSGGQMARPRGIIISSHHHHPQEALRCQDKQPAGEHYGDTL